eukprot:15287218-Heterocapsa_arctica.AAC.1
MLAPPPESCSVEECEQFLSQPAPEGGVAGTTVQWDLQRQQREQLDDVHVSWKWMPSHAFEMH